MPVTLDRPIFHGAAPQAMILLDSCNDEIETAIGLARMQFMNSVGDDEDRWFEVLKILREVVNLC